MAIGAGSGVELATAYVSLVLATDKVPGQLDKSLAYAPVAAERAGRTAGARMAAGIGATLRVGARTVGLAAGLAIGTAFSQGMRRLTAIDDAKGKLAGLGHDAAGVATIMESALDSVRGTAFGLGEAATIAASAVAAGVKPGEALTRYLKLTADAATIAGTSLGDMGSILNKVTTSGKAYTDDLNQLSDRGIPIFQWLQTEYGQSAAGLSKMVQSGKVDAATFRKVIEQNIGGAALQSGKTLRGGWSNLQAALGRVGEGALTPFLPMMKDGLKKATEWVDAIAPKVKAGATAIAAGLTDMGRAFQSSGASVDGPISNWERFGVRARKVADGLSGIWSILRGGQYRGASNTFGLEEDSGTVRFLIRVRESVISLGAALKSPGTETFREFWATLSGTNAAEGMRRAQSAGEGLGSALGKLAGAGRDIGTSLLGLTGDTGTVVATGIRLIGSAMGYLAEHSTIAAGAIVAFGAAIVAQKVVHTGFEAARIFQAAMTPADIASRWAMTRAIIAQTEVMRAHIVALGGELPVQQASIRQRLAAAVASTRVAVAVRAATSALGQFALAQRTAAASSGLLVGGLQRTAAGAAMLGARVQAGGAMALDRLRSAGSSVMGMFGGPWGVALASGAAAVLKFSGDIREHENRVRAMNDAWKSVAATRNGIGDILGLSQGEINDDALVNITQQVRELNSAIESSAGNKTAWHEWRALTQAPWNDNISKENNIADQYAEAQRALEQLGMSDRKVAEAISSDGAWADLDAKLRAMGSGGQFAAKNLGWLRDNVQKAQSVAANTTRGFLPLSQAIKVLSDESASASDRLNAMKTALDVLTGKPIALGDATQRLNEKLREFKTATTEGWNPADGFGESLVNQDGSVNTELENGARLRTMLLDLKAAALDVGTAGGNLTEVFARNDQALSALAPKLGLNVDQLRAMAAEVGYMPDKISTLVSLPGASDVTQQLTTISTLLNSNRGSVDIHMSAVTTDAKAELEKVGATVRTLTDKPGFVRVEAPTDEVLRKLNELVRMRIPDKKFNVTAAFEDAKAREAYFGNPTVQGPVPVRRSRGGSIIGAGGPTSDSIPTLLSNNEHVWTSDEVDAVGGHGRMYRIRQMARAGMLRFAEGGAVIPRGIKDALKAARGVNGNEYMWGATGPANFDCSGFIGWLQQIAMGIVGSTKRLYDTLAVLAGNGAGLEPGAGPAGTLFRVGVNTGHMAATIDGHKVEAGGARGTVGIDGDKAGHNDPQFTNVFHLPNRLIAGYKAGKRKGDEKEWTEKDELDLEQQRLDLQDAIEDRDKVYADEDKSATERKRAENRVRRAELDLKDKEREKAEATGEKADDLPSEAPPLAKAYSDRELNLIDKDAAVEDAKQRRDEVYADADATEIDRLKADAEYQRALTERHKAATGQGENAKTLKGTLRDAVTTFAGVAFDAVTEQLPEPVSQSRWLTTDWGSLVPEQESGANDDARAALSGVGTFTDEQLAGQLGYTPKPGAVVPDWVAHMWKMLPKIGIHDSGGWLKPGEMALNLSNKPEPIFNSPAQLQQFAGGLQPASSGITLEDLARVLADRPNVTFNGYDMARAMREFRAEQQRSTAAYRR
ncbi:tape measure protein [Nocardia brasiliensis]|uniref:tape measure protein n=1 Tax=Nocardia brasiliensis TaxID=37326 RepID=UPI002456DBA0|nr:tape measure protein [Nocardia brasiliensis]